MAKRGDQQPDQVKELQENEDKKQGHGHVEGAEVEEVGKTMAFVVIVKLKVRLANYHLCLMERPPAPGPDVNDDT